VLVASSLALAAGCLIAHDPGPGTDPTQADVDAYNQLADQLDAHRSMFLGKDVQDVTPVYSRLYWLDTTSADPKLDRYDDATGTRLAYTFSIGTLDDDNFRASQAYVVTADAGSDPVVYHAYDAGSPATEIASIARPRPSDAKWEAYAVSGTTMYLVDASTPGQTTLLRWLAGADPVPVTTLEQAGATIGEFWDFDVFGTTMIFIESGRMWKLDLTTNQATWLMNMTEVTGDIDFRPDGVLFECADGLKFFDYGKNTLVDMSAKIDANGFQINQTFATAAHYLGGFTRWKTFIVYIGESGLFAYDMATDHITPILLSPERADLRIDYKRPAALDDGTAFVTGLESTDGAVGVDGPTYRLDLTAILQ
jgi:hypothetical protein